MMIPKCDKIYENTTKPEMLYQNDSVIFYQNQFCTEHLGFKSTVSSPEM